jgi:ParB-like chromosome segregation protein Spo0J
MLAVVKSEQAAEVAVAPSGQIATLSVAPSELGERFSALRLCSPEAQQAMRTSLSEVGQLTAVQVFRCDGVLEVFDGLKRLRAARSLGWRELRVDVHDLQSSGAKVRLLCCNASTALAQLEEAWLVRSLHREDRLSQSQIAMLLSRHKSWVCRRLALAEGLCDELTAHVRLGLMSMRTAVELARLPRGNQAAVSQTVSQRGLTTHQTAQLVQRLLAAPQTQWPRVLEQASTTAPPAAKPRPAGRSPAEQLVADAWAMKRSAVRLHARLLERSLSSLGEAASEIASSELAQLRTTLDALTTTLDQRLRDAGKAHVTR